MIDSIKQSELQQIWTSSFRATNCPDKNAICKDREIARQTLKLYQEIVEKNHTNSSCLNPCNLSFQRFIQTKDDLQPYVDKKKASVLKIASREKIKVMRAHELYLWDNLLGEVGGYVGLFLGVSFVQISDLINSFMKWWLKNHWLFSRLLQEYFMSCQ